MVSCPSAEGDVVAEMEVWELARGDWQCWARPLMPSVALLVTEGGGRISRHCQLLAFFAFAGLLSFMHPLSLSVAVRRGDRRSTWQASGRAEELLAANSGSPGKARSAQGACLVKLWGLK